MDFRRYAEIESPKCVGERLEACERLPKLGDRVLSWPRVLVAELWSFWHVGLRCWAEFCVTTRGEERINVVICKYEGRNHSLPCQTALKEAIASFERVAAAMKSSSLSKKLSDEIDDSVSASNTLLGVRGASPVTFLKIPNETRCGFVAKCNRLVKALQVSLPTPPPPPL